MFMRVFPLRLLPTRSARVSFVCLCACFPLLLVVVSSRTLVACLALISPDSSKHVGHGGDGMVTVSGDGVEFDTSLCVHVREGRVFDSQSCVREGDM